MRTETQRAEVRKTIALACMNGILSIDENGAADGKETINHLANTLDYTPSTLRIKLNGAKIADRDYLRICLSPYCLKQRAPLMHSFLGPVGRGLWHYLHAIRSGMVSGEEFTKLTMLEAERHAGKDRADAKLLHGIHYNREKAYDKAIEMFREVTEAYGALGGRQSEFENRAIQYLKVVSNYNSRVAVCEKRIAESNPKRGQWPDLADPLDDLLKVVDEIRDVRANCSAIELMKREELRGAATPYRMTIEIQTIRLMEKAGQDKDLVIALVETNEGLMDVRFDADPAYLKYVHSAP